MNILKVGAKEILDSRGEKTIEVFIETNVGKFSASAPNGKSKGKHEASSYKKDLCSDIKTLSELSEYFSEEKLEKFNDLQRVEEIAQGNIGANSLIALEYACLKAIAHEKKKQVWQLINPKAKKLPKLVGNCIGGGKHSQADKKPDFQEFLLIPNSDSVLESYNINRDAKTNALVILKNLDEKFSGKKNDENALITSFDDKKVLEVLKELKEDAWDEKKVVLNKGIDVASSSFYKRNNYYYENPRLKRNSEEQLDYLTNLVKNFNLFYIEDAFNEEDFESFSKLLKKFPDKLIVGDDLTVTNYKRLEKAIKMKTINGIIIKPNQCGSLIEVAKVCELAKKNNVKIILSHRSGETKETILADLAFGFQADFFKCGIEGDVREGKIKRLMEIEKGLQD